MNSAAIKLKDVTITYGRHPAVHHLNGTFEPGTLTAITGPNGAGKSTLIKAIAGLIKPTEGFIEFQNISKGQIAYLPQASEITRDFPMTVMQMVVLGFWHETNGNGEVTKDHQKKALSAIEAVGLRGFEHRKISTLSAGQFQRALFARVLLQDAPLVLLDEPFAAIDNETMEKLLQVVHQWHDEKRTVICVLHDFEQIREHFPNCLLMARECIKWGDSKDTLKADNLFRARMFREAWNDNAKLC